MLQSFTRFDVQKFQRLWQKFLEITQMWTQVRHPTQVTNFSELLPTLAEREVARSSSTWLRQKVIHFKWVLFMSQNSNSRLYFESWKKVRKLWISFGSFGVRDWSKKSGRIRDSRQGKGGALEISKDLLNSYGYLESQLESDIPFPFSLRTHMC